MTDAQKKAIRWDADILAMAAATKVGVYQSTNDITGGSISTDFDIDGVAGSAEAIDTGKLSAFAGVGHLATSVLVRRLTRIIKNKLVVVLVHDDGAMAAANAPTSMLVPLKDNFVAGGAAGSVVGSEPFALEEPDYLGSRGNNGAAKASDSGQQMQSIAEIDIKVDSIAVTAQTKKLKAKWSPELGQDLNAYQLGCRG